jgi:von Hippel-Lindau disease tumor supressor
MSMLRSAVLVLLSLAVLSAWAPSAHAQKKHPAELQGLRSAKQEIESSITFVNRSKQTIKIFWLNFEGKRELYTTLKDGDTDVQKTVLSHAWLITNMAGDAWYVYLADAQPRTVAIVAPRGK